MTDTTISTGRWDVPATFVVGRDGTEAERLANRASHVFYAYDECDRCLIRPGSRLRDWPCGHGRREVRVDGALLYTYTEGERTLDI